jgi:site-specific recombinase XerD
LDKSLTVPNKPIPNSYLNKVGRIFGAETIDDVYNVTLGKKDYTRATHKVYKKDIYLCFEVINFKNPAQLVIGDVVQIHDEFESRGLDRSTIVQRLTALKVLCEEIKKLCPWWSDPFDSMTDKMKKRLFKKKMTSGTRGALTEKEVHAVMEMLTSEPASINKLVSYAVFFFLTKSGLRASEMCSLNCSDIEIVEED